MEMKLAPLLLAPLLAGCATSPDAPASVAPDRTLIARVLEGRGVVVFEGDLATNWFSYMVEPRDAPGTRLTVVTDTELCPLPGDRTRSYELRIGHRTIHFGLTDNPDDRRWMTDLMILSCRPLEPS